MQFAQSENKIALFDQCKASDMGNKYVLTMTDAFTKYSEIMVFPKKNSKQWLRAVLINEFVAIDIHQSSTQTEANNLSTN
jgi:hypothetical protein